VLNNELMLCERIKDMIIVNSRNVFPKNIERTVGTIDNIRTGNVIAFNVNNYKNKESVIVVAEVKSTDVEALSRVVHERVIEAVGLPAREVMLVQAGTLPKTSSGKLQRALCKERYLAEELQLVAG